VINTRDGAGSRATLHMRVVLGTAVSALILVLLGGALGWWAAPLDAETLVVSGTSLIFVSLGALIIGRASSNRVGWVFASVGLSILLSGVAAGLADRGLMVFDALGGAFWLSWFAAVGLLVLWYPTGRVPGSRWIWAQRLGLTLVGSVFGLYLFAEGLCAEYAEAEGCLRFTDNPIGIPGVPNPEFGWISGPLLLAHAVFVVSSLVSLVVRFRRARDVERLQLKWFLLACSAFVATLVASITFEAITARPTPLWLDVLFDVSLLAMPVAATLAILRYRLYEIDRIISRTVSYALVAGLLGVLVLGVAAVAGSQFETPWVVAATTLGVAAAFDPVRRRMQGLVDSRFNRSRYDAERVMDEFAGSLRDRVDADEVVEGWLGVVDSTMQPAAVGVWVRN
jgi:hypothetical protein